MVGGLVEQQHIGLADAHAGDQRDALPAAAERRKPAFAQRLGHFEFFYTLYLVDRRAADLKREPAGREAAMDDEPAYLPPVFKGHPVLSEPTDQAFTRVFADLLLLYRRVFEQIVLSGGIDVPDDFKTES